MLRAKPGGGVRTGTGSGSLLARMGDESRKGGAGWDIYQEGTQFIVTLAAAVEEPGEPLAMTVARTGTAEAATVDTRQPALPTPKRGAMKVTAIT